MKRMLAALLALAGCMYRQSPSAPTPPPAKVVATREGGYLGMYWKELPAAERPAPGRGLRIDEVDAGTCAEKLGFKPGDVIVDIRGAAGTMSENPGPLTRTIQELWMPSKKKLTIVVRRGGGTADIETNLADLDAHPAVGERAPDFALKTREGQETRLTDLVKSKPVVLIFGSWT